MAPSLLRSKLDLACEPSAVRYARSHARDVLARWGLFGEVADDAMTVVSELATNAVRHAGGPVEPFSPEHGRPRVSLCYLSMLAFPDHMYVAFYDEATHLPPVLRHATPDAESGRGIVIIDALTGGDWGWSRPNSGPGKIVWARLKLPSQNAPAGGVTPRPLGMSA
jgi:hypothetical protein